MFSPRRAVILVAGIVCLWFFFPRVAYKYSQFQDHGNHDHKPLRFPGRPNYLPFHPPPLQGSVKKPPLDPLWATRADSVKQAFLHAYRAYERYAPYPYDEILPLTNGSTINLNGWGLTMVDSLDTMLLLGLEDDFKRAVSSLETLDFSMSQYSVAPFFETVIRYLGGFLSAYAISREPVLLALAKDLGQKLLPAFNTPSGLPIYGVNTETGATRTGWATVLAEIASCQMEYKYLAYLTGDDEYFTKADKVMDVLQDLQPAHGMWPTMYDINSGTPNNAHHSVGAWADSAYEYLLKQYLLSGKTELRPAKLYMKSIEGIIENLLYLSNTRNLLYITDANGLEPTRKFDHLSCFFPGLLALGVSTLPDTLMTLEQRELHMWAAILTHSNVQAEGLAHTCWIMYADQPSGLGAEMVTFDGGKDASEVKWMRRLEKWKEDGKPGGKPPGVGNAAPPLPSGGGNIIMDYSLTTSSYLLRPEASTTTLESMFIMYRTTHDVKWRDRGWQIWEAIESKTRTASGYASVYEVENVNPNPANSLPSYFLAETVKYAYLIALEQDPWPAEAYILNTEAHPLPVFTWDRKQRERLGLEG
ncbi:glycoside hydrolase family 47 protein [Ramaria rubella]|nr:glycoside hydrolase family 47 protein [Ramaria rubella]